MILKNFPWSDLKIPLGETTIPLQTVCKGIVVSPKGIFKPDHGEFSKINFLHDEKIFFARIFFKVQVLDLSCPKMKTRSRTEKVQYAEVSHRVEGLTPLQKLVIPTFSQSASHEDQIV